MIKYLPFSFLVIFILTGPIRLALISKVLETFIFLGKLRTYKFLYIYYIKIWVKVNIKIKIFLKIFK